MRLRTRFCYLSGFCYYVHTAIFTLVTPAIPLTLLIFMPERVRLINYVLILPSLVYNLVVFPAWHRCQFGPSAFMAKALYGWAHLFCLVDLVRGKRLGWQATGSRAAQVGDPAGMGGGGAVEHSHVHRVGAADAVADDAVRGRELRDHAVRRAIRIPGHLHDAGLAPELRADGR